MDHEMQLGAPQAGIVMEIPMNQDTSFENGDLVCKLDSGEIKTPVFGRNRADPFQHRTQLP